MNKLKPCPFCGGKAVLHGGYIIIPIYGECEAYADADIEESPCYVECTVCHSIGQGFDEDEHDEKNAVKAWNKRAGERNGKE